MMTLTIDEIKDLAQFCGLEVNGEITEEDAEVEITVTDCPKGGVKDDDDSIIHCRHIAYYEEYPDEGVMPLGELNSR